MLVLTRKQGEAIDIGDDVKVVVVSIRGGTVKLGIDAPRSVPVWRREVRDAGQRGQER
ncbi:MAG: carbon storage regulator CsrA [bacterium]|nr:carbon storage regulator CsrA [bacterium]